MSTSFFLASRHRRNLTPKEQGERWRQAGGTRGDCWYSQGQLERRHWLKGWDQEDAKLREARTHDERASES